MMRISILLAGFGALLLTLAAFSIAHNGQSHAQATHEIAIGDIWYCDPSYADGVCVTSAHQGDTIVWTNTGELQHTVTGETLFGFLDEFDSGILNPGETFTFSFPGSGEFDYSCTVHPGQMAGRVTVGGLPAGGETPTPAPAEPTPTPATTPAAAPPTGGPPPAASLPWLAVLALAVGAALLLASAGLGLRAARHK